VLNGKLCLQFTNRFWNQRGSWGVGNGWTFADTGYQSTWDTTRGLDGVSGILVNYTGGSAADALALKDVYADSDNSKKVSRDAQQFLSDLEPVYPGITQCWNGKATESKSYLSPLYKSGYSYYEPGQYQWFAGYEYERQGRVLFAGEHTHGEFQGWMEGAALTGKTAAADIVADLRFPH
ncbi:flavin monoamine oxidase family protein, partial [Chloroflexota bacterium]